MVMLLTVTIVLKVNIGDLVSIVGRDGVMATQGGNESVGNCCEGKLNDGCQWLCQID